MGETGDDAVQHVRDAVITGLRGGGTGLAAIESVCRACVDLLPVDGASVSVMTGVASRESLYASDLTASRIEALQFSLGEGPCFQAFDTQRPVFTPDVRATGAAAWPVFAAEIVTEPVGAVFAFPLVSGAISIGALDMYRRAPGWLSRDQVAVALRVVDIATLVLLGLRLGEVQGAWTDLPLSHAQVHQATGMLIAEFAIPAEQALARLRGYAFAIGRLVDDVADDLVSRRLAPVALGPP
ncbi:GAF and ANTAR domain-containing protein [Actinokineospora pegani]|uniref:GAF and ANTAR domain-containing protein n=1 Tax=Actinokineospora pegani TaxID=2654637 RepID=UPI0012EA6073|nr:GAF and ANTAR domain-containing protein [Actinokineospora pegani]